MMAFSDAVGQRIRHKEPLRSLVDGPVSADPVPSLGC